MRRLWLTTLALLLAAPAWGHQGVAKQEDKPAAGKPGAVKEELQKLEKEREDQAAILQKEFQAAKDRDEQAKVRDRFTKMVEDFMNRGFALAEKNPKDEAAVEAVIFAIQSDPSGKATDKGVAILLRDHVASAKIGPLLEAFGESDEPKFGTFLRAVMDKNPDKNVQGVACLNLAKHLKARAEGAEKKDEAEKLEKEANAFLATAAAKFADAKTASGTVGEAAKAILSLIIGNVASDIEGVDVDGKKFKLSDYKGKVVLLDFWAGWCGPCMRLVPHNLALMKKLEGKPFAVVGVNLDKDTESAKKAIDEAKITWRSFHDAESKIGMAWRIQSIPALFAIDAKGVMRHKWIGANNTKEMDEAIEALVKEVEKDGATSDK